jgi:hypothetical protein
MILIELLFAVAVVCFMLLLVPILLLLAGVAGAVMLWLFAPAVLIGLVVGWLVFPGMHSAIVVVLLCLLGLLLLERRSRYRTFGRP